MNTPVRRDTARVVLAGPGDRVLLFRHLLPRPWAREGWLTPGGGIDPGETPAQALVRELREEIGLSLGTDDLGGAVAFDAGRWWTGDTVFATVNWYFFARTASLGLDFSGQEERERGELLDHRWWRIADLDGSADLVFPVGLAELAARLVDGDRPREPVELPWE
ncbi:NUDIX hydrolase [Actinomadura rubrisoli]|nr:NUDIX domain-containing protein [Actinomadura rubrisoli]